MKRLGIIASTVLLAGCGTNWKSIPFSSSREIMTADTRLLVTGHGAENLDFYTLPTRDPTADGRIVTVAVSGGGMRAAAYTLGAMAELDDIRGSSDGRSAFELIDRASSVSGGSWAMAGILAEKSRSPEIALSRHREDFFKRFKAIDVDRRSCWARRMTARGDDTLTSGLTFGEIYSGSTAKRLPTVYFNASLFPSQSPFVFTDGYIARYKVAGFGAPCIDWEMLSTNGGVADVKIGFAASASSAVPAFTKAWAATKLCNEPNDYNFCRPGIGERWKRSYLQLLDGGIYDNIGWKTPLELAMRPKERASSASKVLIVVDVNESPTYHSVGRWDADDNDLASLAIDASFPNQNSTFQRLRDDAFVALGYQEPIMLDFASLGGFRADQAHLLDGLDELAWFAANHVRCYTKPGTAKPKKVSSRFRIPDKPDLPPAADSVRSLARQGQDCLSENFYRTGYLHKTTYKYDGDLFLLRYQLGQLVVRMQEDEIRRQLEMATTPG